MADKGKINRINIMVLILLVSLMLIINLVGLILLPDKKQPASPAEINQYKCYWILFGISQTLLTIAGLLTGTFYSLRNTIKKPQLFAEIAVMLLISIMWLMIVIPSVFSYYKRNNEIKSSTITEINDIGKD
ncbi:MAG: hypothetical protein ACYTER_06570 [Planctomycetota bacterium]|jgi:carbon starvation protein CstA